MKVSRLPRLTVVLLALTVVPLTLTAVTTTHDGNEVNNNRADTNTFDLQALARIPSGLRVRSYDLSRALDGFLVTCPEYDDRVGIHGPRMYHPNGEMFWAGDSWRESCVDVQIQTYHDQPVLTFWYNDHPHNYGVLLDTNYTEIARVQVVGHKEYVDLHELRLTSNGHALVITNANTPADTSQVENGARFGFAFSPIVQEIDVATGALVWEWRGIEHVNFRDSYRAYSPEKYDYTHMNSVFKDEYGDYLMSLRACNMVIKVDHITKDIVWQLGGKHSDFKFTNGSAFVGQHDAQLYELAANLETGQWVPGTGNTEMILFDNGVDGCGNSGPWGTARGIWLRLDYRHKEVTLVHEYLPPVRHRGFVARAGGIQALPNGNVLVSFGSGGDIREYTRDGRTTVFDASARQMYRAYKYPRNMWFGQGLPASKGSDLVVIDEDVDMIFATEPTGSCSRLFYWLGDQPLKFEMNLEARGKEVLSDTFTNEDKMSYRNSQQQEKIRTSPQQIKAEGTFSS
ncbi:hypothetical protein FISHEDRAFT_59541 [Fistulina hepatica ATCC 64428]|uniref:ASST-domain-containing protein n=1 Tax=Fistulina hepatica ATCC 64428 TaxID=1128425 RepID=A0A0D7A978_9AGAR|nr:hypothetical protein FISHEDRAFT_59541 [Fistulina hepatica ATCC 64428]